MTLTHKGQIRHRSEIRHVRRIQAVMGRRLTKTRWRIDCDSDALTMLVMNGNSTSTTVSRTMKLGTGSSRHDLAGEDMIMRLYKWLDSNVDIVDLVVLETGGVG